MSEALVLLIYLTAIVGAGWFVVFLAPSNQNVG